LKERRVTSGASDISVIIPFFNRERYIEEAVQSVLAQTLQPLEILIVNDCSRESSRRYLDRYANLCRIVDLPVNVGLAGARNAGIRLARGQFIALLDDDDIWLPRKLELQRKYMEDHPECSGVHSAVWAMLPDQPDTLYRRFGTWWKPISEVNWLAPGEPMAGPLTLAQALMNDNWVIPSTMMFRTEVVQALGGFDPHFRQVEDRDFIVRFCAAGYQIEGIYEPLAKLRREGHSSLTGRRWRIFRSDLKMCWKHRALFLRAYGWLGIVWFLVEKLQEPTFGIPYVYGAVRRLYWIFRWKCPIKSDYKEPVGSPRPPSQPAHQKSPIDKVTLIGGHSL
jgi:glycosyltransferase involved in cell wall biosynthesis